MRESDAHRQFASSSRRRRARGRRRAPYQWLGAGALALGLGTAMAGGTGVAHADVGGSQTSSTGHSGHSGRTAPSARHSSVSGPTRRSAPAPVTTSQSDRAPVTVDNAVTEGPGRISLGRRQPGPRLPSAPGAPLFAAVLGAVREVESAVHRRVSFGPSTTTSLVEQDVSTTPSAAVARATAADAGSPTEAEREQSVADLNMSVGWIPGVGTVLNGLSLVSDFLDFTIAALRGDTADMGDEVADMTVDVIGMIPVVGAPLAGTIARLRVPDPAPGDHAPSPGTDTFTTDEDTPLIDNVLSNDTDADGDVLTATLKKGPAHGVVSLEADGSFTYTPTADYYGADVFTYIVSDGPKSKTGTVKITVNPINDAPVAGDDAATLDEDTSAVIAVLSNDSDADHDPLSVVEATAPGHGTISLGANGAITYTPTANYNGSDSFDYTVSDGNGGTATATVHLTVNPVSDVAVEVSTDPATGVATGTAVSTDPEAGPLTYSGSTTTAKGAVVVAADGSFTYTPTTTARHESARVGAGSAQTTDTFTITATDAAGGTTTIAVSVAIAPANAAPVIAIPTVGTPNTSTGVVTGTVTATDPDGDVLVYSTPRSTALGSVVINSGTGVFTYTPTDAARRTATASTTDSFTVTVDDGYGGVTTTTVTVSVAPVGSASSAKPAKLVTSIPAYADGTEAAAPIYVVTDPNGLRAYAINANVSGGISISVVDTVTNKLVGTPLTTSYQAGGAALSADGRFLYVSDTARGVVSVINTTGDTLTVDSEIALGISPGDVVASPDGAAMYVTNYASDGDSSVASISVIDTTTRRVVGDPISLDLAPSTLMVSPDSARLFVLDPRSGQVAIVDTHSRTVTATVQVGQAFGAAVMSPDGNAIYLANSLPAATSGISVVDTVHASVADPIATDYLALYLTISPDGKRLYAADNAMYLRVIDTATKKVIGGASFSAAPRMLAPSADGTRVFVVSWSVTGSVVATFDTAKNTFVGSTSTDIMTGGQLFLNDGGVPISATASPDNTRLYVVTPYTATGGLGGISVIDTGLHVQSLPLPVTTTTEAVVSRIPRDSDTIYAEKVRGSDGKVRMIVYMSGIAPGVNESTLNSITSNFGSLREDVEDYIDLAYEEFSKDGPIEEIELVGHSNGGQQMQLYAASGKYAAEVTSVVVVGAPLIKKASEFHSDALAFIDENDPVPINFSHWADADVDWDTDPADSKDIIWYESEPPIPGTGLHVLDVKYHDIAVYLGIAAQFDAQAQLSSAPAVDRQLLANIKRFGGIRLDSRQALQIIVS
ncbi:Ig-like domain-containing protein [Mycobacterium sp. shizuoka-1]|uniref:Ig-like domain-containing protein n=1 Tax=Mycobacterium sp. shizuoka-1 TaxID=2039281 RepID=UPI0013044C81|nr:Ig-like domain-containing protein [Mycobacterium sp. shizuoka-1]